MSDSTNETVVTEETTDTEDILNGVADAGTNISIDFEKYFRNNENILNKGITNVRWGAGTPVCGVDLNETQEHLQKQLASYSFIIESILGSKLNGGNKLLITSDNFNITNNLVTLSGGKVFAVIDNKITEVKNVFSIPSLSDGYGVFFAFEKDEHIGNDLTTPLFDYGYTGSYRDQKSESTKMNVTGDDVSSVDTENYLAGKTAGTDAAPSDLTSQRVGYTYSVITSSNDLSTENTIKLGTLKQEGDNEYIIDIDTSNVVVLSSLKNNLDYHAHDNKEIVLSLSNWSDSAPFTQTISTGDTFLTKRGSVSPIISLVSKVEDNSSKINELDAYSCISAAEVDGDNITFYCYENKPGMDLTLNVKAV